MARSGRLVSGRAIRRIAASPMQRPRSRSAENRSIPSASAIGKDSIGTSDSMIDRMPEGRWIAAV
jgi:hypothetical protein